MHTPPTWVETLYISIAVTCMLVYCTELPVCTCTMQAILMINTTDSYGCVRMHVYMHLAFKELRRGVVQQAGD